MRIRIITLLFQLCFINTFGQNLNWEKKCETDTVIISRPFIHLNSTNSYKGIYCNKTSDFGLRIDVGVSRYIYNKSTSNWLGNHNSLSIGFIFALRHFNFGFRFKPWTVNPSNELIFNSDTLTKSADLNPIKLDYFIGYSIDFKNNISFEPYIGLSRNIFKVINEQELKKNFSIPETNGLITGLSINKYFNLKEKKFISIFLNIGYSFVNFNNVNSGLDRGYADITMGIAYKGFTQFYNKPFKVKD